MAGATTVEPMNAAIAAVGSPPLQRTFFGHPRGLAYIVFAEGWERFSFYGMQALLVLYMTGQLLKAGSVENIAGFRLVPLVARRRVGAAVDAGVGLADLRALHRAGVLLPDHRRSDRRPTHRPHAGGCCRRGAHGDRPLPDGVRVRLSSWHSPR